MSMNNKELVILAGKPAGQGGGGGTDNNAVHYSADTGKTEAQKAQARANIGAAPAETVQTVSGSTPTIAAADNTCYVFTNAVTSITISSLPSSGLFELVFLSGSTATEIVGPEGQEISLAEGCEIAAEMINDMSVRCCTVGGVQVALATVGTWEPPAAEEEEAE